MIDCLDIATCNTEACLDATHLQMTSTDFRGSNAIAIIWEAFGLIAISMSLRQVLGQEMVREVLQGMIYARSCISSLSHCEE